MSADLKKRNLPFSVVISQDKYKSLISKCIPDAKTASRFVSSITSAVATTPALQECVPSTIISCALLGEALGLSPSPQLGQFYLVPFNDKKAGVKKAQFILGAKGYKQLAIRSNQYKSLGALPVLEGEYKGRDRFTGEPVIEFGDDTSKPVIGYYAYFELLTGFRKAIYWSKDKVMDHADKYSQAFNKVSYEKLQRGEIPASEAWKYSSYWYKNFDQMAEKTVIKQLLSQWGILSPDLRAAFESDEQPITYDEDNGVLVPDATAETETEVITVTPDDVVEKEEPAPEPKKTTKRTEKQVSLNDL